MKRTQLFGLIGVLVAAGAAALVLVNRNDQPAASVAAEVTPASPAPTATSSKMPPGFTQEGSLRFVRKGSGEVIRQIDIEIADNDTERSKGLMYRSSMPDSVGMLFIFEVSEPQSFWMKNTLVPLDIIYVDENKQIVTIQANTKPLSEEPIPSYRSAQYVVEVVAGFCQRYGIKEGDSIAF